MKVETLSLVVGSEACNAACPFCVSKMTPPNGVALKEPSVRWERLTKALLFAERMAVTTVILTGKGEPTLFPQQLLQYMDSVGHRFPFVELQTNGIALAGDDGFSLLRMMVGRGLTTVAISIVDIRPEVNASVYYAHRPQADYFDLPALIAKIHAAGASVRLTGMMMKGGIECPASLGDLIDFARDNEVEQVTVRPITKADHPEDPSIAKWIERNAVPEEDLRLIRAMLHGQGSLLLTLRHGAEVFDVGGQNVCLSNCLTPPEGEDIRQIIFFPDGHLRYDWQKPGAILM